MSKKVLVVKDGGPSGLGKKVASSLALALQNECLVKIYNTIEDPKPKDKTLWDSEGVKQFVLRGIK